MPGGESLRQVLDRSWRGLVRASEGLGDDDTLLVVAHDAVNRVLLCRILGLPIGKLWTFRQAPTTLNLLEGPDVESLGGGAPERLCPPHPVLRRGQAPRVVMEGRSCGHRGLHALPDPLA